jgi:hypothetical protein
MSRQLAAWAALATPADLFLALWEYVNTRVPRSHLSGAYRTNAAIDDALQTALRKPDGQAAVAGVVAVLRDYWTDQVSEKGRKTRAGLFLGAMRAIDDAFEQIHPRTLLAAGIGRVSPPAWAIEARDKRLVEGVYAVRGERALIPRGPFARSPRGPLETATFSLVDQFAACAVAPLSIEEDGRTISVVVKVVTQGVAKGVPPRTRRAGSEAITLAPLAEAKGDLVATVSEDEGTSYIDVEKGAAFAPRDIFAGLVGDFSETDVLLLPELVLDMDDVEGIRDTLATTKGERPRMVVCGSGLEANGDEWPWNASQIVNGSGTRLWAHRKNAAYGMLKDTFDNLKIKNIGKAKQLMEKISWSEQITIGDVEGLGRCLVLICQDVMMPGVEQLVRAYEPDWVFLPILDSGTNFHRWPYKRLVDLSAIGPTRFVVVSSLTMLHWRKKHFPGEQIGVAVGPRYVVAGDKSADTDGLAQEINCESASQRHGTVRWRRGKWEKVPGPTPEPS